MAAGESEESQRVLRDFGQRLEQLRVDAGNPDGPQLIKADTSGRLRKTAISELQKGRAGVYRVPDWDVVAAFVNACKAHDGKCTPILPENRTDMSEWKREYTRIVTIVERLDAAGSKPSAVDEGAAVPRALPVPAPLREFPVGFTGRNRDLHDLLELLDPRRPGTDGSESAGAVGVTAVVVAAVLGMGGIGKTTLARAAGHAALAEGLFTGAVFLDLHGYEDTPTESGQALDAALRGLGLDPAQIPPDHDQRATLYRAQLAARARVGERVLLIADNASHTDQIEHLLPGDGPHRLLITSRDDLSGVGARLVDVDVLEPDQAVDLMDIAVCTTLPKDGRIAADPEGARRVAELCGHLPLALRIAAAQLIGDRHIKPGQLADDLEDLSERLDMLDDGIRAVRAVLDRSYRRLSPPQEELFRLLAVNPGPDISTETATALTLGKAKDVRIRLVGLAKASLLRQDPDTGRWRMHDLVRAYATEQARQHPATSAKAQHRLLKHYSAEARDANTHLNPTGGHRAQFRDRTRALKWLDAERDNLVAAVHTAQATGHHDIAMDLPTQLAYHLILRRHLEDLATVTTIARDVAMAAGNQHYAARAWDIMGNALQEQRRFEEAEKAHHIAITTYRQLGDQHLEAFAWNNLSGALQALRRFDEAEEALRTALTTYQQLGDRHSEAGVSTNLGSTLQSLRRFDEAEEALRTALTTYRQLGDRHSEARAWTNLGAALHALRRFDEAEEAHRTALTTYQQLDDPHSEAMAWINLGLAFQSLHRFDEAEEAHRTAITACQQLEDRHGEAVGCSNLGVALRGCGQFESALEAGRRAVAMFEGLGDVYRRGEALKELADTLSAAGRPSDVVRAAREAAAEAYRQVGAEEEAAKVWDVDDE